MSFQTDRLPLKHSVTQGTFRRLDRRILQYSVIKGARHCLQRQTDCIQGTPPSPFTTDRLTSMVQCYPRRTPLSPETDRLYPRCTPLSPQTDRLYQRCTLLSPETVSKVHPIVFPNRLTIRYSVIQDPPHCLPKQTETKVHSTVSKDRQTVSKVHSIVLRNRLTLRYGVIQGASYCFQRQIDCIQGAPIVFRNRLTLRLCTCPSVETNSRAQFYPRRALVSFETDSKAQCHPRYNPSSFQTFYS